MKQFALFVFILLVVKLVIGQTPKQIFEKPGQPLETSLFKKEMITKPFSKHSLGVEVRASDSLLVFSNGRGNIGYKCCVYSYAKTAQRVGIITIDDSGLEVIVKLVRSKLHIYKHLEFNRLRIN